MKSWGAFAFITIAFAAGDVSIFAVELTVGPNQPFGRLEDALAKAQPGDVISVQPQPGNEAYPQVALSVNKPRITIRSAGTAGHRVALSGRGLNYAGQGSVPRAIIQFNENATGCVLDGFELFGAHNDSHNAAGVRINQANATTIRNCDIHHNDMGIMSNGDGTLDRAQDQRIEACIIHHNGDPAQPGQNHNLYLGGASVTLIGCDIYSSLTGHNVKSRAHRTEVRNCSIHDSANRELDLVDGLETAFPGSDAILIKNQITKALNCPGNGGVIHFGQDGGHPHNGTLRLEGNTIRTPFIAPVVQLSSPLARAVLNQNVIENSGHQRSGQILIASGSQITDDLVQGRHNKISPSFSILPSMAQILERTNFLDSTNSP
jgi:hypothetical protein